jgi:hypothetical protein
MNRDELPGQREKAAEDHLSRQGKKVIKTEPLSQILSLVNYNAGVQYNAQSTFMPGVPQCLSPR